MSEDVRICVYCDSIIESDSEDYDYHSEDGYCHKECDDNLRRMIEIEEEYRDLLGY